MNPYGAHAEFTDYPNLSVKTSKYNTDFGSMAAHKIFASFTGAPGSPNLTSESSRLMAAYYGAFNGNVGGPGANMVTESRDADSPAGGIATSEMKAMLTSLGRGHAKWCSARVNSIKLLSSRYSAGAFDMHDYNPVPLEYAGIGGKGSRAFQNWIISLSSLFHIPPPTLKTAFVNSLSMGFHNLHNSLKAGLSGHGEGMPGRIANSNARVMESTLKEYWGEPGHLANVPYTRWFDVGISGGVPTKKKMSTKSRKSRKKRRY